MLHLLGAVLCSRPSEHSTAPSWRAGATRGVPKDRKTWWHAGERRKDCAEHMSGPQPCLRRFGRSCGPEELQPHLLPVLLAAAQHLQLPLPTSCGAPGKTLLNQHPRGGSHLVAPSPAVAPRRQPLAVIDVHTSRFASFPGDVC